MSFRLTAFVRSSADRLQAAVGEQVSELMSSQRLHDSSGFVSEPRVISRAPTPQSLYESRARLAQPVS